MKTGDREVVAVPGQEQHHRAPRDVGDRDPRPGLQERRDPRRWGAELRHGLRRVQEDEIAKRGPASGAPREDLTPSTHLRVATVGGVAVEAEGRG